MRTDKDIHPSAVLQGSSQAQPAWQPPHPAGVTESQLTPNARAYTHTNPLVFIFPAAALP